VSPNANPSPSPQSHSTPGSTGSREFELEDLVKRAAQQFREQNEIYNDKTRKSEKSLKTSSLSASQLSYRTGSRTFPRATPNAGKGGKLFKVLGGVAALVAAVIFFGPDVKTKIKEIPFHASNSESGTTTEPLPFEPPPVETPTEKGSIILRLSLSPGGGSPRVTITAGGRTLASGGPAPVVLNPNNLVVRVPLDTPLVLTVDRRDFKPFKREFVLDSRQYGGLKDSLMDVPLDPLRFGLLSVHTNPRTADAMIMMGDKPWVRRTPIENEKLPIGTYTIRLSNEVLGMEKTVTVTIRDGANVDLGEVKLDIKN
jgi:hypothetical protein